MNKLVVDLLQQEGSGCWKQSSKKVVNRKEKCKFKVTPNCWQWRCRCTYSIQHKLSLILCIDSDLVWH
jgi:hypothetical protein